MSAYRWEIIDENGTIHSGEEEEMRIAFAIMTNGDVEQAAVDVDYCPDAAKAMIEDYMCEWEGDLKLIQIHDISR